MRTRTFMLAAVWAALLGGGQAAQAQFGPTGGPAGPYADMMAPSSMAMPGPSPYAPPAFAPAAYAGIGGPAPMGPMGSMAGPMTPMMGSPDMNGMPMNGAPMNGMPMNGMPGGMPGGPGYGGDYCNDGCGGWTNRWFTFGEFLYLRPRNAEVAYAVPISTTALNSGLVVQTGRVRVADPDYAPGFRLGMGAMLGPQSSVAVTFSQFDRDTFDAVSLPAPGSVIGSLVNSPNLLIPPVTGPDTAALLQTQFQLLDFDYKGLFYFTGESQLAYVFGARYANLEQHFAAGFDPASGFQEVLAESEFDGAGLKLGLEGLRFHPTSQFFIYGKGYTSLVAGTFRTRYQLNVNGANLTDTSMEVGRLVTMLDLETGLGWQNFTGNLRFSMGYMFSSWYNAVKVNEFINSVQTNNFVDPSTNYNGLITFDGVTAKIELLW